MATKRRSWLGWLAAGGAVALIAVGLAVLLFGSVRRATGIGDRLSGLAAGGVTRTPVTAREAEAFAEVFVDELRACDRKTIAERIDVRVISARFGGPSRVTRSSAAPLAELAVSWADAMCSMADAIQVRLLRVRERAGTFRPLLSIAGDPIDYIDLHLAKDAAGEVRIVDFERPMTGSAVELGAAGAHGRLDAAAITRLVPAAEEAIAEGRLDDARALLADVTAPSAVQVLRGLSLATLVDQGEDAFEQALAAFRRDFPDSVWPDIVVLRRCVLRDWGRACDAAIDALELAVGGDPELVAMRALSRIHRGDVEGVEPMLRDAIGGDLPCINCLALLLSVALEDERYVEVPPLLEALQTHTAWDVSATALHADPDLDFAGFLASAPGRAWAAAHPSAPPQPTKSGGAAAQ